MEKVFGLHAVESLLRRDGGIAHLTLNRPDAGNAIDPTLAELRRARDLSEKQQGTIRLTAAQDIAWALINSPAFLFNR